MLTERAQASVQPRPADLAPRAPVAGPGRILPSPAPQQLQVGRMVATLVARNDDVLLYVTYIKGKPTYVYVMDRFDPATALAPPKGLFKDRDGVLVADRDGVVKNSAFLNEPAKAATQAVMLPTALAASRRLNAAKKAFCLATNQGGYETGKMTLADTIAVNVRVAQQIADAGGHVDAIFICPFNSAAKDLKPGQFDARKPSPAMPLFNNWLAAKRRIPVLGMVGDQRTDGAAAQGAGLKFFGLTDPTNGRWQDELVAAKQKGETLPTLDTNPSRYAEHTDLASVVQHLLK